MRLSRLLAIRTGVTAVIGGGGKTAFSQFHHQKNLLYLLHDIAEQWYYNKRACRISRGKVLSGISYIQGAQTYAHDHTGKGDKVL